MVAEYFSDQEQGPPKQEFEHIEERVWRGILNEIANRIANGEFAMDFPEHCPDGPIPIGTDSESFWRSAEAIIPRLAQYSLGTRSPEQPDTLSALDLIQFAHQHVAAITSKGGHPRGYFQHPHLHSFNRDNGQSAFRDSINQIFRRNGIAFTLETDGSIQRVLHPTLHRVIQRGAPDFGESVIDDMIADAFEKILSPDIAVQKVALDHLWDAWERLKTLDDPDKKQGAASLIAKASQGKGAKWKTLLSDEAVALTETGNEFQIRHTEVNKEPVSTPEQIDYLFHRLASLIWLLHRSRTAPSVNRRG